MKFKNQSSENREIRETLGLILSLGAIFIQIWVLASTVEAFLSGKTEHFFAGLILSAAALFCCGLNAYAAIRKD